MKKYYKYIEEPWEQPYISANSEYFSVSSNMSFQQGNVRTEYLPGATNTYVYNGTKHWTQWHCSELTCVKQVYLGGACRWNYCQLLGSNDGETWTEIPSTYNNYASGTTDACWVKADSNTSWYYYHRIYNSGGYSWVSTDNTTHPPKFIRITANRKVLKPSTIDNYDVYLDMDAFKTIKLSNSNCRLYKNFRNIYFKHSTSPNVTLIGDLTCNSGIISGFSKTNYAKGYTNAKSSNIVVYLKVTPTSFSQTRGVVFASEIIDRPFGFSSDGRLGMYTGSWTYGTTYYSPNQAIWVRLKWNGSSYVLSSLKDNGYTWKTIQQVSNWITQVTWNNTTDILSGAVFKLGRNKDGATDQFFSGSIDLFNSFIMSNNQICWYGTEIQKTNKQDYDTSISTEWYKSIIC